MSGERLTQRQNAAGAGVADEGVLVRCGERVAQKACPDIIGKGVRRYAAFGKADAWSRLCLECRQCLAFCLLWQRLLLNARHIVTALGLGIDVAFDNELGVGIFYGDEADAQIFGQHALGGQLFLGVQDAAGNIIFDAFVKVGVHALTL